MTEVLLRPEGEEYLDFQENSIRYALRRKRTLIADQPGLGKGHPLSTRLATPTGFRSVGELKPGDYVIGSDGKPTRILRVYHRGTLPIYRVHFNDGASVLVDGDHLWSCWDEDEEEFVPYETTMIAAIYREREIEIPVVKNPVEFYQKTFAITPMSAGAHCVCPCLEGVGYIPSQQYIDGSISQRIAFLAGAVRSIGRVREEIFRLNVKHNNVSDELVDTLLQITRSLGGLAFAERRGLHTRVDINLPEHVWTSVIGYKPNFRKINRRWKGFVPGVPPRIVTDVVPAGRDAVICIEVDAPDHLYLTEEFLVTHNTVSGIGLSNNLDDVSSVLIVCLASHKEHWKRAIERWDIHGLSVDIATGDYFPDTECVIINYDILWRHYDSLRAGIWDVLIVDEAHNLQNENSRRTVHLFGSRGKKVTLSERVYDADKGKFVLHKEKKRYKPVEAHREVFLTGTPIPNRVKNLWPIIARCDPNGIGRNYDAFAYRYCGAYQTAMGMDDNGASNLDELRTLMRERFMVRHLKADVLKDLPPKIRQIIPLSSEGLNKKLAAEKDAVKELLRQYESELGIHKDMDDADLAELVLNAKPQMFDDYAKTIEHDSLADTPLNKLAIARAELALEKVPMIVEHVSNLMDQGEKVIVFAYHRAVIEALRDRWSNSCALIYGGTPAHKRQAEADRFQEDPNCNPFIGQYTAAGTGYTLTASSTVVCTELTWLPHELVQAEDRAHRFGQEDVVNVHHLVVTGSLDDALLAKVIEKQEIIDLALDG